MSLLPPQAIDEFQALWKKHYGVEVSREEATMRAHQVFTLVRMLVQGPHQSQSIAPSPPPSLADCRHNASLAESAVENDPPGDSAEPS